MPLGDHANNVHSHVTTGYTTCSHHVVCPHSTTQYCQWCGGVYCVVCGKDWYDTQYFYVPPAAPEYRPPYWDRTSDQGGLFDDATVECADKVD